MRVMKKYLVCRQLLPEILETLIWRLMDYILSVMYEIYIDLLTEFCKVYPAAGKNMVYIMKLTDGDGFERPLLRNSLAMRLRP